MSSSVVIDVRNAVVREGDPGRCVLCVPYRGNLSMAARGAITALLHELTVSGREGVLTAVLAIATDDHVSVFAEAPPAILSRLLQSDQLLRAAQQAINAAATGPQDHGRSQPTPLQLDVS